MEKGRNSPDLSIADSTERPFCPHPEVLAAWVDQGLGATERAGVEAHLAGCDECRVLVAHVLEIQDELGETPAARLQPSPTSVQDGDKPGLALQPGRSPRTLMQWSVGALAVAAALMLAVQVQPTWWPGAWPGGVDSRLADLADAVGLERTVEARLTGGFRHGPLRAPVRSGGSSAPMDNWKLYAAAGRIREDAEADPNAANLHALGLSYLVLGQYDEAIQAFEDAIADDPNVARYQSDLSAAYLARARQLDRPDDLPRALGAAERAISSDGTLVEPRFNRALALQSLFLEDQARRAWEEYLTRDATSAWAEEARRHLAALQRSGLVPADPARIDTPPPITDTTVEAGLDWVVRLGLPAWADAVLAGDAARASREHSTLITYAQEITNASGDGFASSLVELPSIGDPEATAYAIAVRGFGRALAKMSADDQEAGEKELRSACAAARGAPALLCEVELGALDVLHRDDASAERRAASTLRAAKAAGYGYVEGRALQLEGYRRMFRSDYGKSVDAYRQALDVLERRKYLAQAGVISAQLAELFDIIGLPLEAWRWRHKSLEVAARTQSPMHWYVLSVSTGGGLARSGNYEAGRAFLSTHAADEGSTLRRVPGLVSQGRAALVAGDTASARDALVAADRILAGSNDFRAKRLIPDLSALLASVLFAEGLTREAETKLDEALSAMGPERAFQRAGALLERARILSASITNPASAEQDIRDAVALLDARAAPAGQPVRLDDAAVASGAIAALVSASPSLQSAKGLALAEHLRELLDGVPAQQRLLSTTDIEKAAAEFDRGSVGVFFLFSGDSLLAWVLADGRIEFTRKPLEPRLIARHAARLGVELARTPDREDVWKQTLAELYDLVLRDLPAIGSATEIVVVPDGPLYRVPFGALVDKTTGQFVFDRTALRVSPNLAFAIGPASQSVSASVLSVGDPQLHSDERFVFAPLPKARSEALAVAALYPKADVLLGEHATKPQILARMQHAGVIHYAGHAVAPSSGGAARLLLAGSAADPSHGLSLGDLSFRLANARVVLAACDTASARPHDRATGVSSLASEFLRAGASAVVATLWKVDDSASAGFFVDVHRGLAGGQRPATALARAQRACSASSNCRTAVSTWIGTTVYGHD